MKPTTWTMQNGRTIEIKWMQSAHLVNTFNMQIRDIAAKYNQRDTVLHLARNSPILEEIKRRGLLEWRFDVNQLVIPDIRETEEDLRYLQAALEINRTYAYKRPSWILEKATTDPIAGAIVARATAYRMMR